MAKANETWNVLPHQPIEKISENIWRVQGDLSGMPLKRVMTIVKRAEGDLVIHNAIALEPELMAEIDAWGKVAYLIVPNGYHRLDAKIFKQRYPQAKVLCPKDAKNKVSEVVSVDGSYEDFPIDPSLSLQTLEGTAQKEGVLLITSQDGVTLVLNDILFNMPHRKGLSGFIFKHVTQSSGGPRISRVARLFVIKDKLAVKNHLLRLSETENLRRVIVSHHEMITQHPKEAIRIAVAGLS